MTPGVVLAILLVVAVLVGIFWIEEYHDDKNRQLREWLDG